MSPPPPLALLACVALLAGLLTPLLAQGQLASVDAFGRPLPVLCINCTYVEGGFYHITNGLGDVTWRMECLDDPVINTFCSNTALEKVAVAFASSEQVCKGVRRDTQRCFDSKAVTWWGDMRLDPSMFNLRTENTVPVLSPGGTAPTNADYGFIFQGGARDVEPTDYANMVAYGTPYLYTDVSPRPSAGVQLPSPLPADQGPNMYAFTGNNPFLTLLGVSHTRMAGPAGQAVERGMLPDNYYHWFPDYRQDNSRVVFYFGYDSLDAMRHVALCALQNGRANSGGASSPLCLTQTLYSYITGHRGVRTAPGAGVLQVSVAYEGAAGAEEANRQSIDTALRAQGRNCGVSCFLFMRRDNSKLEVQPYGIRDAVALTFQPPGGLQSTATVPLRSFWATVDLVQSTGQPLSYPLFALPVRDRVTLLTAGVVVWVEESRDRSIWSVHPESLPETMAQHIRSNSFDNLQAQMLSDYQAWTSGTGDHYRVFVNTGLNRFMRIRYYKSMSVGQGPPSAALLTFLLAPAVIMHAETRATVELTVVPSLDISRETINTLGYKDACVVNALCAYLPHLDANNREVPFYPPGPRLSNVGSPLIRSQLMPRVLTYLYGACRQLIVDPVAQFLSRPALEAERCYRLEEGQNGVTCYRTERNTETPGSPVRVLTDVFRTSAAYVQPGVTLIVYQKPVFDDYPVPDAMIGSPYTPRNTRTLYHVYDRPVKNSLRVRQRYVSLTLQCEYADENTLSDLPLAPVNCPCTQYQIYPDVCLCSDRVAWRELPEALPAGLTFSYPYFFTPQRYPGGFRVTNKQLIFNMDLFTVASLNCTTYLCSGSASRDCLDRLVNSNYMAFCRNQEIILRTTLSSLRDQNNKAADAVAAFLAATGSGAVPQPDAPEATATLASLGTFKPPAASGPTGDAGPPDQLKPLASSIRKYFEKSTAAPVPKLEYKRPNGYNYRDPRTTPGEALGMAVFPWIGVGVNTEKINELAVRQEAQLEYITGVAEYSNYVGERVEDLAGITAEGFAASLSAITSLAESHNQLVSSVNTGFERQNIFNGRLAETVQQVGSAVQALEASTVARINFLDLIGSRASTLGVQVSAIMVKALEQTILAREFANRVTACTTQGQSSSAAVCADSATGLLIGVSVRQRGPISTIDSLLLEPTEYEYAYGTPEFCYGGQHFLMRSDRARFVVVAGRIYVSPVDRWAPQNITEANTLILDRCQNTRLVVQDFTPEKPLVLLEAPPVATLEPTVVPVNITAVPTPDLVGLRINDSLVDISDQVSSLSETVERLRNFTVTPLNVALLRAGIDAFIAEGSAGIVDSVYAMALAGLLLAIIALVALAAWIVYSLLKGGGGGFGGGFGKYMPVGM